MKTRTTTTKTRTVYSDVVLGLGVVGPRRDTRHGEDEGKGGPQSEA